MKLPVASYGESQVEHDLFTNEGQALFTQEVARLLAEQKRRQKPDLQQANKRLQEVEREIANTMAAIKAGIRTPSTKLELEKIEAERAKLLQRVQGQQRNAEKVTAFLPNAIGRFKALLDDLANVTQMQVDKAREPYGSCLGRRPCSTRLRTA